MVYNSLSSLVDAKIMVSKHCPIIGESIIGEYVAVNLNFRKFKVALNPLHVTFYLIMLIKI